MNLSLLVHASRALRSLSVGLCTQCKTGLSPTERSDQDHIHVHTHLCEETGGHRGAAVEKVKMMIYDGRAAEQMLLLRLCVMLTSAIQPVAVLDQYY